MTALLTQEQKSTAFLLIRPYNAVSSVCVCVYSVNPDPLSAGPVNRTVECYITSHRAAHAPVGCVYTLYFPGSKLVGGTSHTARLGVGPSKA